jgi:hypothetical protein
MYLNDLNSSKHNVQKINSVLASTFGHNVKLSEMSTDALHRMLRTTNAKIEAIKESDFQYWENAQYNKLNLIAHSLRTYINEVAPARKDGKAMKKKTMESKRLMEQDLAQAEVLLAAQELVDKLQKMVEDVAAMQVQELMPITDAMKEQIGFDVAEQYNSAADSALGSLLDQLKATKESLENATLQAQGKPVNAPAPTDMGPAAPEDMGMDDMGDDFEGDDAAAGADNSVGRELKAESKITEGKKQSYIIWYNNNEAKVSASSTAEAKEKAMAKWKLATTKGIMAYPADGSHSESVMDRMERDALKEQRVVNAKKKVLEAARAAGYTRPQLEKLLKQLR